MAGPPQRGQAMASSPISEDGPFSSCRRRFESHKPSALRVWVRGNERGECKLYTHKLFTSSPSPIPLPFISLLSPLSSCLAARAAAGEVERLQELLPPIPARGVHLMCWFIFNTKTEGISCLVGGWV